MAYENLNPDRALIWRIVHRDNLPWIFANGLHCGGSPVQAANWVNIGNAELIAKRTHRAVPLPPGGTLNDYVPFYFTPFSPMMYNIHTSIGGVPHRRNEEIAILVAELRRLDAAGVDFVFTDRHAYLATANFYNQVDQLSNIDWELLRQRNFQRNADDPSQFERYQAETLIHRHLPIAQVGGIVCYNNRTKETIEQQAAAANVTIDVRAMPQWYF